MTEPNATPGEGQHTNQEIDMLKYLGWFDSPDQEEPSHDPRLLVDNPPCIICDLPLSAPLKTVSFMWADNPQRSYFYRAHRECIEGNPSSGDTKALDMVERFNLDQGARS